MYIYNIKFYFYLFICIEGVSNFYGWAVMKLYHLENSLR